jgi:hypothetical protein
MLRVLRFLWIGGLLLALTSGCGGSGYHFAPVSGTVKINGQPAAGCHVSFEPVGSKNNPNPGPGSIGRTDDQGHFTLESVPDRIKGAIVGKCRVRILRISDQPDADQIAMGKAAPPKTHFKQLPPEYNFKSKLTFDVPAKGTDSADFDLTLK